MIKTGLSDNNGEGHHLHRISFSGKDFLTIA
jgi:hypothetical protein